MIVVILSDRSLVKIQKSNTKPGVNLIVDGCATYFPAFLEECDALAFFTEVWLNCGLSIADYWYESVTDQKADSIPYMAKVKFKFEGSWHYGKVIGYCDNDVVIKTNDGYTHIEKQENLVTI